MISNEFIQEANLWSQSQKEETFMMTLWSIRNKLPYLFGYLVPSAWNLVDALIENGINDYQAKSLYISRAVGCKIQLNVFMQTVSRDRGA